MDKAKLNAEFICRQSKTGADRMGIRAKTLFVLILLTILGLGPLPLTSVIGIYIVIFRPRWFKDLVLGLYDE